MKALFAIVGPDVDAMTGEVAEGVASALRARGMTVQLKYPHGITPASFGEWRDKMDPALERGEVVLCAGYIHDLIAQDMREGRPIGWAIPEDPTGWRAAESFVVGASDTSSPYHTLFEMDVCRPILFVENEGTMEPPSVDDMVKTITDGIVECIRERTESAATLN